MFNHGATVGNEQAKSLTYKIDAITETEHERYFSATGEEAEIPFRLTSESFPFENGQKQYTVEAKFSEQNENADYQYLLKVQMERQTT